MRRAARASLALLLCLVVVVAANRSMDSFASEASEPVTPAEHRRPTEQTFLTYPEWFLVHSPTEFAVFVRDNPVSEFPLLGHVGQFWQAYGAVYAATREDYPFNTGYHVMIMVIGVSTTVEYALRTAYETVIGRLSELTRTHGMTEEEILGARVAQEYVDFILETPWYKFGFLDRTKELWTQTSFFGPDMIRKWERKYALTTEYLVKAGYAWVIAKMTGVGYEAPILSTTVLLDGLPEEALTRAPELEILKRMDDGSVLVSVPRYAPFTDHAVALARHGATFVEIAGNRTVILVSVLARNWEPPSAMGEVLFTQPILTQPDQSRWVLVVPVTSLSRTLADLSSASVDIEHIYDY